mmetsp:Transcript_23919/g.59127  ORF Transcript_23919/g.59127 Transcript_23919/m.59127 type:complete len:80 (-) Transcript_23919:239-478(-)
MGRQANAPAAYVTYILTDTHPHPHTHTQAHTHNETNDLYRRRTRRAHCLVLSSQLHTIHPSTDVSLWFTRPSASRPHGY